MKESKRKIQDLNVIRQKRGEIIASLVPPDRTKLLTFEEATQYFKNTVPKKFGAFELVLLLLGVFPNKPISGKTMMMKQTFLSERSLEFDIQDLQFVPHKFGPHSFLMEETLRNMEFVDYVRKIGSSRHPKYLLTDKGKKTSEKILGSLSDAEKRRLRDFRITCDELGTDGILRYVYENFQEFTDASLIKRRYQSVDWVKGKMESKK